MERHNEDLPSGKESEHSVLQQLAPFLTIGFQLAASVTIFFFGGRWLDHQLNYDSSHEVRKGRGR
jgi:hypothetical protein